LPVPPLPVAPPPLPTPTKISPNSQPNPVAKPNPQSHEELNQLDKVLAALRKKPTAPANPVQGGAPNAGGSPLADDTGALTAAQRGAIGSHVRPCWTTDPGMPGLDKMQALLTVTTDGNGTVRLATIAPADQGRLGDPLFRAFAERAVRAVLDPQCANLPLPPKLLGHINTFTFRFSP
jgi:hypothetical protein